MARNWQSWVSGEFSRLSTPAFHISPGAGLLVCHLSLKGIGESQTIPSVIMILPSTQLPKLSINMTLSSNPFIPSPLNLTRSCQYYFQRKCVLKLSLPFHSHGLQSSLLCYYNILLTSILTSNLFLQSVFHSVVCLNHHPRQAWGPEM